MTIFSNSLTDPETPTPLRTIRLPSSERGASMGAGSGMMLAALSFALSTAIDTIFKLISAGHPASQIILVNALFALLPVLGMAYLNGGLKRLHTARAAQHMARGIASVLSTLAAIYAYTRLPLTDFYAIVFAGPLLVTAMSAFWLGEKVEPSRWLAIIVGFAGIILVVNPFATTPAHPATIEDAAALTAAAHLATIGRFAAFISVFCYGLSVVMIRRMRVGESNLTFALYTYIASIVIGGTLMLIHGAPILHGGEIALLAFSGTLAGFASIALMTAYHRSPVALVAPFQYTQIIWGAVSGYFIWHQLPGLNLIEGAVIVAASGLFVIYREVTARS
jgi:drug/metabolite transporter (DMT)-like permease